MICDTCKNSKLKSLVKKVGYVDPTIKSYSYYDENGEQHFHNKEALTTHYICSNGHMFSVTIKPGCWCGFKP
jgi:hypothetical protein